MSFQVTPEVIGGAAAAGAAIGALATKMAISYEARHYRSVVEEYGPLDGLKEAVTPEQLPNRPESSKKPLSWGNNLGRWAVKCTTLPVIAGVAGGIFPLAFGELPKPNITSRPYIEEAMELSGQTSDNAANIMVDFNRDLSHYPKLNIDVILSRGSSFQQGGLSPGLIGNYSPTGSDSLFQTTNMAIGEAFRSANPFKDFSASSARPNRSSVLVVEDDNDLDPEQIVSEAKNNNTAVNIVNVGPQSTNENSIVSDLKEITSQTGGHYYAVTNNKSQEDQTAAALASTMILSPQHFKPKVNALWQDVLKALDCAAALSLTAIAAKFAGLDFRRRKLVIKENTN